MIPRLRAIARLVTFVGAVWILVIVFWALATGGKQIGGSGIAGLLAVAGIVAQLALWFLSKAARGS